MKKPLVFNFDSPVDFLNKFFDYKFYSDSKFSLKSWCLKSSIKYPRLKDVLKNKTPIKGAYFEKAQQLLELNSDEYFYFLALIRFHNAKKPSDQDIFKYVLENIKQEQFSLDEDRTLNEDTKDLSSLATTNDQIFSNHLCMTILSMANLKSFRFDSHDIASKLSVDVNIEEIQKAMDLLIINKLMVIENDQPKIYYQDFLTKSDISIKNVHSYYKDVFQLAIESIPTNLSQREFQSFSCCLNESDFPKIKKLIRKFRDQISKYENNNGERVYHFNLQGFPLTQSTCTSYTSIENDIAPTHS